MSNNAYIVSAVRTAGGKKNGSLSQWHPADLGAKVLNELVHQTSIDPELIDIVLPCNSFPYTSYIVSSKLPDPEVDNIVLAIN